MNKPLPRTAIPTVRIVAAIVLVVIIGVLYVGLEKVQARQLPINPQQLSVALIRLNLSAQALTAAGVPSALISGLVNDVQDQINANPAALSNATASLGQARAEHDRLQRLVQSGVHAQADLTAYNTAVTQLNSTQTQLQSVLDDLWTAGTADLTEGQRTVLSRIRSNSSWEMPIEFLTVNRAQAQWVQLREALANERISAANDEPPDPAVQELLAQLRADVTVSAAIANLSANLAANTAAWNQAVND